METTSKYEQVQRAMSTKPTITDVYFTDKTFATSFARFIRSNGGKANQDGRWVTGPFTTEAVKLAGLSIGAMPSVTI